MVDSIELLECPLCDFTVLPTDDYILQLHFEQAHTEDSPFVVKDDPEPLLPSLGSSSKCKHVQDTTSSDDDDENTVACPEPDCGELVLLDDFNDHLDFHAAETLTSTETYHSHHSSSSMHKPAATHHSRRRSSKAATSDYRYDTESLDGSQTRDNHDKTKKHHPRSRRDTDSSEKSTLARSILSFNPFSKLDKLVKPPVKSARLGKSELGPHAWEERMPRWLHEQLAAGPKITTVNRIGRDGRLIKQEQVQNETPGVIPILAQLSALDRTVKEAYYCHPSTLHIGKTPKEGSFCGYRNIQMLISYIQGAKAQGHEEFPSRLPGILKLQEMIERAWDKGINRIGRIQTGGIKDTRKYIGTPEAQALFLSTEINCAVEMFSDKDTPHGKVQAHDLLLLAVERYFAQAAVDDGSGVHKTLLPPIYLQRPGHSLTIVGFERRSDSYCNLVVLDPVYATSPAMHKLIGRKNIKSARPEVMHAYRRGPSHLRKFAAFEILILTATPPLFPVWDVLRQFPDCSYVYAFFRARTLGYDVYPEDYFLRNFPWQQYGGLWIVNEARFARAEPVNPLTAQALRRITGAGASLPASDSCSPISYLTNSSFGHRPVKPADPQSSVYSQHHAISAFDGSASGFVPTSDHCNNQPVFNIGGSVAIPPQPDVLRPNLTLLTEVSRRYPGFPSPLSPTLSAKELYPTPTSVCGSAATMPRNPCPTVRSISPMSLDGSNMCGPSTRCRSHNYEHFASQMDNIDSILARNNTTYQVRPTSRALSMSSIGPASPTSPQRALSPRASMLRHMAATQALRSPNVVPGPGTQPSRRDSVISNISLSSTFSTPSVFPISSRSAHEQATLSACPSIQIANGTEFETGSPISPTGTMLSYTSNRAVDSGLLAIPALSEPQVAEYRFWVPCGRRSCAFGCGGAHEGENAAAKRLFKGLDNVVELKAVDKGHGFGRHDDSFEQVQTGAPQQEPRYDFGRVGITKPVEEWRKFLMNKERDVSVARV
ncbi:peptidase family C78-domain-containing protein [Boeremia exigua]|uniref:peptidase family C78-domain-containing protein n=1 Tax=Boeremia exigua TaxID=749465 RepID=UPI001E8EAD70|nr:peptidase family C78-domain-containing protein [Boeremia exigua]KAH6622172.1 peptidase family C78-domain-containing protein [Boeremia exigua]